MRIFLNLMIALSAFAALRSAETHDWWRVAGSVAMLLILFTLYVIRETRSRRP